MKNTLICGLLLKNNKIMIAKRAETKKHFPGTYDIPGGHLEASESKEECLAREFKEEFAIDIVMDDLVDKFDFINNNQEFTEYVYFATMKNESQKIILDLTENSEYLWINADEVEKYFKNSIEKASLIKGFNIINKIN